MTQLQTQTGDADERARSHRRKRLVKHLLVFQFKLLLEGLKDLVLGPLSIAAATLDFILAKDAPDRYLDGLMRLGQRYEDWLGLYRIGEESGAREVVATVEVVQVVQVNPQPPAQPAALPHDSA